MSSPNSTPSKYPSLASFDFKSIDDQDPALANGHEVVYSNEIVVEVRSVKNEKNEENSNMEPVRFRVLVLKENSKLRDVVLEITSERDVFLHYSFSISASSYSDFKNRQGLRVDFPSFPNVIMKQLDLVAEDPDSHMLVLEMYNGGTGRAIFVKNFEFKFIELLSLDIAESSESVIRQSVSFRYSNLKARITMMHSRLHDVHSVLKLKSPTLLLQIQKQAVRSTGYIETSGNSISRSPSASPGISQTKSQLTFSSPGDKIPQS
eukprot:gb/GECH01009371.1/.p1 GENE.gb/GECH01009371.1/~~gb/GECH01009371.1/.p1  ORF type:complete len:263 (+),score=41.38 gb/GECH01009371.1/:1-789(+)